MSSGIGASAGLTRRDTLRLSGLALGGLALGSGQKSPQGVGKGLCAIGRCYPTSYKTDAYTYGQLLPEFDPLTPIEPDEMRITFLGSAIPPNYRAQEMMSIFVQVGDAGGASDQAVFDCGSGVCSNYGAMGIGWGQMNKVLISHLHGDHMSDLSYIYQAGPQADRKTPLFVFGPGPSGLVWTSPDGESSYGPYDDGTKTFCEMLRAMLRWQSESFCFTPTGLLPGAPGHLDPATLRGEWGLPSDPVPVMDPRAPYDARYRQASQVDDFNDGYAVVPVELPWANLGAVRRPDGLPDNVAYFNGATGLKISHFPVIHTRQNSIGYKVEWNGLSMVYTSDTRPEVNCIAQANNVDPRSGQARGVDVFIHEMVVPPEVWAMKIAGLSAPGAGMNADEWARMVNWTTNVQASSHTPPGAFGYILSRIAKRPRLTVPTHFPLSDDTVACALKSVQGHVPDIGRLGEQISWSFDLMVLRVFKDRILQHRAAVSDYSMVNHGATIPAEYQAAPKYWKWDDPVAKTTKVSYPEAQIADLLDQYGIPAGPDTYDPSGY